MKQNEPSFLSLNDDEGRHVSCKIRGKESYFSKGIQKEGMRLQAQETLGAEAQRHGKHDALKGAQVTGQKRGYREILTARATQAREIGRACWDKQKSPGNKGCGRSSGTTCVLSGRTNR